MSLKNYLRILKIWIVVFPYFVIKILLRTYYTTRTINNEFYFYLYCILFGIASGIVFCSVTDLYDCYPFDPLTLSFDETNILNDDINNITEKSLRNQEEIKSAKKGIYVWLAVTTVVYCILVFAAINS